MTPFKLEITRRTLVMDGAYGTNLQQYCSGHVEELNLSNPDVVISLHRQYLTSGANIIISNTFSINPYNYSYADMHKLIKAATVCINKAVGNDAYKAYDIGSLGKLIKPLGDITFEECKLAYEAVFRLVDWSNYDLVYIETQQSLYEAKAAILAAKIYTDLPIVVSFTYQPDGRLLTGEDVRTVQYFCKTIGVAASGMNCSGGPTEMAEVIKEVLAYRWLPALIKVNAGIPVSSSAPVIKYTETPLSFVKALLDLKVPEYAAIVGGCCGTSPEFISKLASLTHNGVSYGKTSLECLNCDAPVSDDAVNFKEYHLKTLKTPPQSVTAFKTLDNFRDFLQHGIVLSSQSNSLIAYPKQAEEPLYIPFIIGEKINPTGKSPAKLALQQALDNEDLSFILELARSQVANGAQLLDVNLSSHYNLYPKVIEYLQQFIDVPLVIDYPLSDTPTEEQLNYLNQTLEIYNGIPLFNSYNTHTKHHADCLRFYGAVSVYLPMSDGQFDNTRPAGNMKVVDPLCFSLSTNPKSFYDLSEHLTKYHDEGFLTSLGLSNISFKCPDRPSINISAFLKLPNLNFAIVNPEQFQSIYNAIQALKGKQTQVVNTTDLLSALLSSAPVTNKTLPELLEALDEALKLYDSSKLVLPQLVTVSENIIKALPATTEHKASFLIATVQGDLHDLGKNIVSSVLRASGFKVIDLGKNVSKETVLENALKYKPDFIGLSSLLTTTIPIMKETVQLLKSNLSTPIIIGGAVYSKQLVKDLGADFFAQDAPATVSFCNDHIGA